MIVLALLVACGGGTNPAPDAGSQCRDAEDSGVDWPAPGDEGAACSLDTRVGGFEVADLGAYSAVSGSVAAGVLPITVLEEVGREGDCVLLRKENPFCDPPCAPGELCNDPDGNPATDGTCEPYPPNLDAGPVHVAGILQDVIMLPDASKNYSETCVPDPLFDEGAPIQLFAEGAEAETFSLDGTGVAPLEADTAWTMSPGTPLDVVWTPSDGPGRIWLSFNVDQHGNSPVTLVCDVEDTGATTVPATLIDQLIDFGVSGFATGLMRRRTVDSVQIAEGCVDLLVYTHLRGALQCDGCPITTP